MNSSPAPLLSAHLGGEGSVRALARCGVDGDVVLAVLARQCWIWRQRTAQASAKGSAGNWPRCTWRQTKAAVASAGIATTGAAARRSATAGATHSGRPTATPRLDRTHPAAWRAALACGHGQAQHAAHRLPLPGRASEGAYDALVIGSGIGGLAAARCCPRSAGGSRCSNSTTPRAARRTATSARATSGTSACTTSARWGRRPRCGDDGLPHRGPARVGADGRALRPLLRRRPVFDAVAGRAASATTWSSSSARGRPIDCYIALMTRWRAAFARSRSNACCRPGWRRSPALAGHRMPPCFDRTTWQVLSELTDDRDLIAVLTGQWGDIGLPPKRSAFAMQATISRHYLHGGFYPVAAPGASPKTFCRASAAPAARSSPTPGSSRSWCASARCARAHGDGHEIESAA